MTAWQWWREELRFSRPMLSILSTDWICCYWWNSEYIAWGLIILFDLICAWLQAKMDSPCITKRQEAKRKASKGVSSGSLLMSHMFSVFTRISTTIQTTLYCCLSAAKRGLFLVNSKMLLDRASLASQWENTCIEVQSCTDDGKLTVLCSLRLI